MDEHLLKRFQQNQEISNDWYNCASDLNAATRVLYASRFPSNEYLEKLGLGDGFRLDVALNRPTLMNAGLALELMMKACLVRMKTFDMKKDTSSHNLLELSKKASVVFTYEQRDTLKVLSNAISWFGRYPIPKSEAKYQENSVHWRNLRKASTSGTINILSSDEKKSPTFENYNLLWSSAHHRYWEIEPKDPREFHLMSD